MLQPSPESPRPSPRWWEWKILLHGDGWEATWYSQRPAVGRVRLTGRLVGDFSYATTGSARGRVLSARGLSAVRHESGVLAELDLDDVPPPPLRPSIVPATISAYGRRLWVADHELPQVVRLDDNGGLTEFVLPGRIYPDPSGHPWRVHADAEGCWVAGWDGVYRCADSGNVRRLGDRSVGISTTLDRMLLTCTGGKDRTLLGLWHPDGSHTDIDAPAGQVMAVTNRPGGFWVLVRRWTGLPRTGFVVAVDLDGALTIGPEIEDLDNDVVFTADPPQLFDLRGIIRALRPDLTVGEPVPGPLSGFRGGTADGWVWIMHHDRERALFDNRRYWHLTLVDPSTQDILTRVEVHTPDPDVTVDAEGTVWVTDAALAPAYSPSGTLPPPLHVADLLDNARTQRQTRQG